MADGALPVVDIGPFGADPRHRGTVCTQLMHAMTHTGFVYLEGLGMDRELQRGFAVAREFFARPLEHKLRHAYASVDANFGFQKLEVEALDPASPPDLKESFTMRNALAMHAQSALWPGIGFRDASLALYAAAFAAAGRVLEIFAACLQMPGQFFVDRHRGENVTLRLLRYPANLPQRDERQLGAGAHTDYGSITLLFQDDVGGLEVRGANGQWVPAPPVPGAALINTGDLMERWTNGRFRSTLHRVRPVAGARDRYSIAMFVDPDPAVCIETLPSCIDATRPARFAPITAGEHIAQKIAATHRPLPETTT